MNFRGLRSSAIMLLVVVWGDSVFSMRSSVGILTSLRLRDGHFFNMAGGFSEFISRYEPTRGAFARDRQITRAAYAEARERNAWMLEQYPEQYYVRQRALDGEEQAVLARIDEAERFATEPVDAGAGE